MKRLLYETRELSRDFREVRDFVGILGDNVGVQRPQCGRGVAFLSLVMFVFPTERRTRWTYRMASGSA